jgi:hypothetical protein
MSDTLTDRNSLLKLTSNDLTICTPFLSAISLATAVLLVKARNGADLTGESRATHAQKGGYMKKFIALLALCLSVSVSSFGAENVVGHSTEVAAKDSYQAVKISGKETGHAGKDSFKAMKLSAKETGRGGKALVKFLF